MCAMWRGAPESAALREITPAEQHFFTFSNSNLTEILKAAEPKMSLP